MSACYYDEFIELVDWRLHKRTVSNAVRDAGPAAAVVAPQLEQRRGAFSARKAEFMNGMKAVCGE